MQIDLDSIANDGNAYEKFLDSMRDSTTRRKYRSYLKKFLAEIPDNVAPPYSQIHKAREGTIGFTGYNGTEPFFIGAGHTFQENIGETTVRAQVFARNHTLSDGFVISTDTAKGSYLYLDAVNKGSPERTVDAGYVILNENAIPSNQLQMKNGTIVDLVQGSAANLTKHDTIHMFGIKNNSNGTLLYTNATVSTYDNFHTSITMKNQLIGNYTSEGGDSGAPVVVFDDSTAHIVGIHNGIACEFTEAGVDKPFSIDLRRDENNDEYCRFSFEPEATYYKTFGSWDSVKDEFNIP